VAQLQVKPVLEPEVTVHLFRSASGEWEVNDLHVHGVANPGDLHYWSTDATVAYGNRFLIWVDYYRGMILADMSRRSPKHRYVPLPVYSTPTYVDEEEPFDGRGCPEASRSVCVTRSGVKFVIVDTQRISSFGLGCVREWKSSFRITTWSFREDDHTWRRDATVYEELWAVIDPEKRFPRVSPDFPVVNVEDPDAICFRLKNKRYNSDEPAWMIEVDVKKMVLLAANAYDSKGRQSLSGDDDCIIHSDRIRRYQDCHTFITSEVPRYLYAG